MLSSRALFQDIGGGGGETRPIKPRRPRTSRPSQWAPSPAWDQDRTGFAAPELGSRPMLNVIFYVQWFTAGDERTCPVCAPLNGTIFEVGRGITIEGSGFYLNTTQFAAAYAWLIPPVGTANLIGYQGNRQIYAPPLHRYCRCSLSHYTIVVSRG